MFLAEASCPGKFPTGSQGTIGQNKTVAPV